MLFVIGGAGGVGSIAIQLARALTDMTIIATASRPETIDWVKELGAHHVINNRELMEPQVEVLGLGAAGRLTVAIAIAKALADEGETDAERDVRLHDDRSFTTWTDGDGMTVIRIVLAPSVAKPAVAAVDEMMRRIAQTPLDETGIDDGEPTLSADRVGELSVADRSPAVASGPRNAPSPLPATLRDLRRRWQPADADEWVFASVARQRADAFVALFLGCDADLTTEVVIHVRGDGVTFDDGTPTTGHAVLRRRESTGGHPRTRTTVCSAPSRSSPTRSGSR